MSYYDDRKLEKKNSKEDAEVEITAAVPVVGRESVDLGYSDEKVAWVCPPSALNVRYKWTAYRRVSRVAMS
jgi:hypothetical protein